VISFFSQEGGAAQAQRGGAVVIIEHPAEALSPVHRVRSVGDRAGLQESISETPMNALSMVVRNEVGDRQLKRGCVPATRSGRYMDLLDPRQVLLHHHDDSTPPAAARLVCLPISVRACGVCHLREGEV
jgi:hypothetical protein